MIIKIFGADGEGKSTVAQYIYEKLSEIGVIAEVENEDFSQETFPYQERLKIIGNNEEPLKVEIKTIPYGRETVPEYAKNYKKE